MKERFVRTAMLLGEDKERVLNSAHVTIFGLGGVGGQCAEALARAGIGHIHLVDADVVSESNLNRQLIATKSNVGKYKTECMRERIEDISDCHVTSEICFVTPENAAQTIPRDTDYVIDAIDTVSAKLAVISVCKDRGIPVISCMGAGNRLDPSRFKIIDIFKTSGCPLARVMRRELRKRSISALNVVMSDEMPQTPFFSDNSVEGRYTPGSVSFVPAAAGLLLAAKVIWDISGVQPSK